MRNKNGNTEEYIKNVSTIKIKDNLEFNLMRNKTFGTWSDGI